MKTRVEPQFDFGANWKAFSDQALTAERVEEARLDFRELFAGIDLREKNFLDVGFGQGLGLLIATELGAKAVGCDISPTCAEVMDQNRSRYFPALTERSIPTVIGSILDTSVVEQLRAKSPDQSRGTYDVVHSWGVLHHTGDMQRAIHHAASLVAPGGYLVIAIYARHWSSSSWRAIKRFFNTSPPIVRRLLIAVLTPVIYIAKWIVTGRNPLTQRRGMSFRYDVVDWLGGYPYEYATREELSSTMEALGFEPVRFNPAGVPTGCNEFVFRRAASSQGQPLRAWPQKFG